MTLQKLFAIRDDKMEAYMPPICFVTRGQAIRWFSDLMHSPEAEVAKHPEDYKLMYIGEYQAASGLIGCPKEGPVLVIAGLDVMSVERGGVA